MKNILSTFLLVVFTFFAAEATIYTVTNTSDAGPGSFRDAILQASTNFGPDDIHFAIPGAGPHVIAPISGLPQVGVGTTVDGYTQPGAMPATSTSPAILKIVINGSAMTVPYSEPGIWTAGNCTIKGLVVQDFVNGFSLAGDHNVIQGNYLGTTADGSSAYGNMPNALFFTGNNNLIGGPSPSHRNVISGITNGQGVSGYPGANFNTIMGNYFGTDATGMYGIPNAGDNIGINGNYNTIANNLICGAGIFNGIYIVAWDLAPPYPDGNVVTGNTIGMNTDLTAPIPNGQGVSIYHAINTVVTGNTIAGNIFHGVLVDAPTSTGNLISQNSIYDNNELGINLDINGAWITPNDPGDLDDGPNNLQNYPVLNTAKLTPNQNTLIVKGEIDTQHPRDVTIEFYANSVGDPLGHGEGELYLGSTANVGANGKFTAHLPGVAVGSYISALAIDADNNTSEFSLNIQAAYPNHGGNNLASINPSKFAVGAMEQVNDVAVTAFPNPFYTETTLAYHLPESQLVKLRLFDKNGRLVQTLYSGYQEGGAYSYRFNSIGLPSGTYTYQLITKEQVLSGKIVKLENAR